MIKTPYGDFNADVKTVAMVIGGIVVLWWLLKGQIKDDFKKGAQAVNPINPENVFNKVTEGVYSGVTGSEDSPGGDVYDATHNPDGTAKGGILSPFHWLDKAIL